MKRLYVAAGILTDRDGRVLITERLCDGPFNGLWEFPGGKIAAGESPEHALVRELREELGIEPRSPQHLMRLEHEYPDRFVAIEFFLVREWQNVPVGREGQRLRWVNVDDLDSAELLPADLPVIDRLKTL